jgi:hypothetical protein
MSILKFAFLSPALDATLMGPENVMSRALEGRDDGWSEFGEAESAVCEGQGASSSSDRPGQWCRGSVDSDGQLSGRLSALTGVMVAVEQMRTEPKCLG